MTREEALRCLKTPAYDPASIDQEFEHVATKLRISTDELSHYLTMPKKFYWDYKNQERYSTLVQVLKTWLGVLN